MRRRRVSLRLAEVTQHIHSLRASGVMPAHESFTIGSDSIACRKSAGRPCTVPAAIGSRAMVLRVYRRGPRREIRKGGRRPRACLTGPMDLSDHGNMQRLQIASVGGCTAADCAAEILEAVPAAIRFIRAQMRRHRGSDLSVPQFRTLAFIHSHPGVSLSVLSDWLGLSLPATSRLVGGLVRRKFVSRRTPAGNRRVVALSISARGNRTVSAARRATVMRLAAVVAPLSEEERGAVRGALFALRRQFEAAAAPAMTVTERVAAGRRAPAGKSAPSSRSGAGK